MGRGEGKKFCQFSRPPYTKKWHFRDPPIQQNGIFETPYTKNAIFETPLYNKMPFSRPPIQKMPFLRSPYTTKCHFRDPPIQIIYVGQILSIILYFTLGIVQWKCAGGSRFTFSPGKNRRTPSLYSGEKIVEPNPP